MTSYRPGIKEDDTGFKQPLYGGTGWFGILINGRPKDPFWGRPFSNARWAVENLSPQNEAVVPAKRSPPFTWRSALMATCFLIICAVIIIISLLASGAILPNSSQTKNLTEDWTTLNEEKSRASGITSATPSPRWSHSTVNLARLTTAPKQNELPSNNNFSLPNFISGNGEPFSIDVTNRGPEFFLHDESATVPLTVTKCLDFYSFHRDKTAPGGVLQKSSVNNVEACKATCDRTLSCLGFSFNRNNVKCSIVTSQPSSLQNAPGVTYYIRHGCHYCLLFQKRDNTLAYGGQEQERDINTEDKCFAKCAIILMCWGFDFSRETYRCYLHFSVINPIPVSGNVVQYTRIGCDLGCSSGYSINRGVDVIENTGISHPEARDLPACQRICDSLILCQAFSFRYNSNTCRIFLSVSVVIVANPWSTFYNKPFCTVNTENNQFSVRLVGGSKAKEGRVEIQHQGKWGTICDDNFTDREAEVICNHLGYGLPARAVGGAYYGEASPDTPIWLDDLTCNDTSGYLKNCTSRGWGIHNCRHNEDVGVACGSDTTLFWQVRLNGGRTSKEGHVQVRLSYTSPWFFVCDDYWDFVNSDVVCKELGLGNQSYAFTNSNFGKTTATFVLDDVRCDKGMSKLRQCSHRMIETHDCRSHEIAGVQCFFDSIDRQSSNVRLLEGASYNQGRLEVYYNSEWGTVCDDSFDDVDASVTCKELGFKYGQVLHKSLFSKGGAKNIWLDDVECDQADRSIFDCRHNGWTVNDCTHDEDVGLECFDDFEVRLVDGLSPTEGRVEVKHRGQWGTICDDSFGNVDALVVCRMLGCIYGEVQKWAVGSGKIWLDEVECTGKEKDITFCPHNKWGEHNCTHAEDVGVICFCQNRSPLSLNNYTQVPVSEMKNIGQDLIRPLAFTQRDPTCTFEEDLCGMDAVGWLQYTNFKVDSRIRLVGGSNPKEGRVEVLHNGQWGTICHNLWDDNDATAVCKMFGYRSGTAACCNRFGRGSGPIWLDQVNCSRDTQSLWGCSSPGWEKVNCGNRGDAGVVCRGEKLKATNDATYISTDDTSPMSTIVKEVKSIRCMTFKYRMPVGMYIYAGGAEAWAFTPFTFNPIKAGGLVISEQTSGKEWKYAEVDISTSARHAFLIAMATNGSQIHITNVTDLETSCSRRFACPSGKRKCRLVKQCYPIEAHCDGVYDCLDSSDENYCHPPYYTCEQPSSAVTTLAPSTSTSKPKRCLERTFLGNGDGAVCYFPYVFEGRVYDDCTNASHHQAWCAVTDNFDRDQKWGNCLGCACIEKTNKVDNCVFPFQYKGGVFYACTYLDYSQRWCSTTPVYSGQWGICQGCIEERTDTNNTQEEEEEEEEDKTCVPYTRKGNSDGAQCYFPFLYKGSQFFSCTGADHTAKWCAVVPNYDVDQKWGQCAGCSPCIEDTISGNDGGNKCAIPFIYKGQVYHSCTKVDYQMFWCATTPNFDTDKKWGVCNGGCDDAKPKEEEEEEDDGNNGSGQPNNFVITAVSCRELTIGGTAQGALCIFPFYYRGVIYTACTTRDHSRPWCSITFNYDADSLWGNCIGCPVKEARSNLGEGLGEGDEDEDDDSDESNMKSTAADREPVALAEAITECSGLMLTFNDGTLGGGVQSSDDDIRWRNVFGNTPTNGTGPSMSRDFLPMTSFTYGTLDRAFQKFGKQVDLIVPTSVQGKYIYAEMSSGVPGNSGSISFTSPSGARFLRFHYYMSGRQVGKLSVSIDDTILWEVRGDQHIDFRTGLVVGYPSSWRFAQIPIPTGSSTVKFTAVKGNGPLGDIAIDHVVFAYQGPFSPLWCPTVFFQCGDGNCIPARFICDGIRHCRHHEDETGCPQRTCPAGFFNLCADGRCLPESARCDGIVDCTDLSDEASCGPPPFRNQPPVCSGFTCNDGQCIESQFRCDQIDHCQDGSDEVCSSSNPSHRCSYGEALSPPQRCNWNPDCFDASDEAKCGNCEEYMSTCGDFCVPPEKVCDGFPDCSLGTDESGRCDCRGDQVQCDRNKCISRELICDGNSDCQDGSDELEGCKCHPQFHMVCGDGTCVGLSKRCDGQTECPDYSDEIGCGDCKSGYRKCDVDFCVLTSQWCDGITHCPDSSDEKVNCECEKGVQFACGDRCVPLSNRCDKKVDCSTSLDEMNCSCSYNEKPCKNGVCLDETQFCNGVFDCEDSSDEFQCKCAIGQFSCKNGLCINASWRCNKYDNCGDESDEVGCPCSPNEFICNSTGRCIAPEYRCDGVRDCANGEDEKDCAPRGPISCSPNQIPCNFTCVSKSYRCNGIIDCAEIPAGSDETKCLEQRAVPLQNSIAYITYVEKGGQDYVICYDKTVWNEQWSYAVCRQLGQGPVQSTSGVRFSLVGGPANVLFVTGVLGEFLQKSLTPRGRLQCSSSQAVAVICHPPVCGLRAQNLNIPNTLIVGGEMSHPGMWPWQVQLKIGGHHNCGATLLDGQWAVTAAHCVTAQALTDYVITAGSIYRTKDDPNRQSRYASRVIKHPQYNSSTFENDLALIKLGVPFALTDYVRPACVPRQGEDPAYRDECQLTGWGRLMNGGVTPERLRDARFTIWNDLRCATNHSSYKKTTMLCAGKSRHFASACFGDSGGPLVCRDSTNRWTLTGIVSWAATPCAAPPTFYVKVAAYADWIKAIMERFAFS